MAIISRALPEIELLTLADFEGAPEPEETGSTYEENARIKADSAASFTGEWSLADDAGLEIDALGGIPGVHSKRFEGENTAFPQKIARILEMLEGVPKDERSARFQCYIALSSPSGEHRSFHATCEGRIAEEPSGKGGFGYDPIFILPEEGCTMADLTADEKHEISHRGKVLRQLIEWLRQDPT